MGITVGIPRCLLYYNYYPGWKTFFTELGADVVLSPPTNKGILDLGVKQAVDEVCLPIKVFFGHIMALKDKVDYLFIPRIVSVSRKEWICPKFIGLPDMIKAQIKGLPSLIHPDLNIRKSRISLLDTAREAGRPFTTKRGKILRALYYALREQVQYEAKLKMGKTPLELLENQKFCSPKENYLTFALLGHSYLIYESYITMGLIKRLRGMGIYLITPEMMSDDLIHQGAAEQPKELFWTLNKITIGAANYFFTSGNIDGIIQLASFGCGPDALINELIERRARREGKIPLLSINLDEHTGEAGLVTRLEAFIDMIKWKERMG